MWRPELNLPVTLQHFWGLPFTPGLPLAQVSRAEPACDARCFWSVSFTSDLPLLFTLDVPLAQVRARVGHRLSSREGGAGLMLRCRRLVSLANALV